jgi:hypothetical protein
VTGRRLPAHTPVRCSLLDWPVRRARVAVGVGMVACTIVACRGTTYDESLATPDTVAVTTSTSLPSGDAADLLPRLVDEARTVGQLITAGGDHGAAVNRVEALWTAVQPEIGRTQPELLGTFEGQIDALVRADQFKRAADADKAYKNLRVLVDAYLDT